MTYDSTTGQLLLFGQIGPGATFLNNTWSWDGSTRTEPRPRRDLGSVTDQVASRWSSTTSPTSPASPANIFHFTAESGCATACSQMGYAERAGDEDPWERTDG